MATELELQLWEQMVFEFGVELPIPEMPKPSAELSGGVGFEFKLQCPGAPYCLNPNVEENCTIRKKYYLAIPGISITLPFPPEIAVPPLKVKVILPPSVVLPLSCPNYDKDGKPKD